ncbi:MAG: DUF4386 domain-containing protein [Anditalea sp.]
MKNTNLSTRRKMALVTGFSLVAMALIAGFAYGYAFQSIYVAGDGTATLMNLNNSKLLLRLVIFSFVVILILDVVIAWALYFFFKQVNEPLSLLCAWLRLIGAAFLGVALLNLSVVLQLLNNIPQNEALIMNSLRTFLDVWSLGLMVFAFHLFLLGRLILNSGYIPKVLGILTLIASVCYLLSNMAHLLLSNYDQYKGTVDMVLSLPMALGELGIAIWLMFKGAR